MKRTKIYQKKSDEKVKTLVELSPQELLDIKGGGKSKRFVWKYVDGRWVLYLEY